MDLVIRLRSNVRRLNMCGKPEVDKKTGSLSAAMARSTQMITNPTAA